MIMNLPKLINKLSERIKKMPELIKYLPRYLRGMIHRSIKKLVNLLKTKANKTQYLKKIEVKNITLVKNIQDSTLRWKQLL